MLDDTLDGVLSVRKLTYKEKRFIVIDGFRGFGPKLIDSVVLEVSSAQNIMVWNVW